MPDIAIRAQGLGKQFTIGGPQERYKTLRDTLTDLALAPARGVRNVLRGEHHPGPKPKRSGRCVMCRLRCGAVRWWALLGATVRAKARC